MKTSKFQKIFNIMLVLLISIATLSPKIFAAQHTLAINSSEITVVNPDDLEDSNYAFSLKATSNTHIEMWGNTGTVLTQENWIAPDSGDTKTSKIIMPKDDSLSGNIGCWFYDCGYYKGKKIDVKCTFYWKPLTVKDTKINPVIAPTIDFTKEAIAFNFYHQSYEVKYELYSNEKPIHVNMSLTFGDIDGAQHFGIKTNDGNINQIKCRNDCRVFYSYKDNYHWTYADYIGSSDEIQDTIRYEFNNINSFNVVYGYQCDYYSYPINRIYPGTFEECDNEIIIWQNRFIPEFANSNADYFTYGYYSWAYFNALGYGPYSLPEPIKNVTDTNEFNVTENTISESENFSYSITQHVPLEASSNYYYKSFLVEDNLPSAVNYISSKVINDSGEDVTDLFLVSNNGGNLIFKAKDPSVSSFYNDEYKFIINVKLNKDKISQFKISDSLYRFTNTANVSILRNRTESKNSNTVTTNYYTKDIQVNKIWKDANNDNRPTSINYTLKQDGAVYYTGTITANNNWTVSITDLPKYDENGNEYEYTVEETQITLPNGDTYIPSYNGLTITNTLHGKTNLTVTKIWADWNNKYMVRPDSINIDIKNKEGQIVKTVTLTAQNALPNNSNVWELQVDNLEKYDKDGVLQTYTISEQINNKLQSFYKEPQYNQENFTVTNIATYVPDVKDEYPEYKIIVNKNIINNKNQPVIKDDFDKIKLDSTDTYEFPIVLKALNREVVNDGKKLTEVYEGYSGNVFNGILTNKGDLVFNNIPAGKYEIIEMPSQYFTFVDFKEIASSTNAVLSEENGKYFITLPGLTAQNEEITINTINKLDTERPYDEDETKNNFFKQ